MIKRSYEKKAQKWAYDTMVKAGVPIRPDEENKIAIVDFGLNQFEKEGMHLFTLVHSSRYAVKALAHLPWQTEPEHWHPPVGDDPGKQETVRVLWGTCYFYLPSEDGKQGMITGKIPEGKEGVYTCAKEMIMKPGDQITLEPGVKHWFQGGPEGAVIYTFSSTARDTLDGFSDPAVCRVTEYINDLEENEHV